MPSFLCQSAKHSQYISETVIYPIYKKVGSFLWRPNQGIVRGFRYKYENFLGYFPLDFFSSSPLLCSSGAVEVVTVDVHAAKDLLHSGHSYLDVRTEEEFKKGHVENALNIPYMFNTPEGRVKNPKFMKQVLSVCNKEDQLVVGCQSGVRSVYATTDLLNADFKNVCNMGGGYIDWVKNGFAVKKPEAEAEL